MRRLLIIGGCLIAMAGVTRLTMELAQGQAPAPQGDAKRGEKIASDGTPGGVPACVSCHAVAGNPDGSGTFPRLFGMSHDYMVKQLADYAANRRTNDIMNPVAKSLSPAEAADVTAYYATAKEPLPKFPPGNKQQVGVGEKLATVGDEAREIPACNNCHGPSGVGASPVIPFLAGQFAPYITQQLQLWKEGTRKNDGGEQMSVLAKRLSEQDFTAAAAYYQQVPTGAATAPAPKQ